MITAIDFVGKNGTSNTGGTAMDQMKAKIVEKGSADVQLISGATITTLGVIDAVKNAIDPTANPFTPKEEKPAMKPQQFLRLKHLGRPLKAVDDKIKPEDIDKYNALPDEEKAMLAEVTTTMSLTDSHGNILAAIKACLDNKVAIDLTVGK